MNSKRAVLGAAIAVLSLSLSACGDPASPGQSSADGKVKLQMVESLTSPSRTELLRSLLRECEEEVPGVEVELISPPTEQADQKIQQMLQAGSGVDILEVRDITVGSYSTNGWLVDMAPQFKDWKGKDALADNAREFVDVNEDMWLIPYGFFGLSIFYRTDLIKEAGYNQPPETWDELLAQATKIQDPSKNLYGYAFRGGQNGYQQAVQVIESYVANRINRANAYFLEDGSTIFAAPEAKSALDLYLKLFQDAAPPSSIAWGFPEMVEAFANGSTAFLMQDPEVITALQASSTLGSDQWNTTPVLKGPEGKAFQAHAYAGWGVAKASKNPDKAVEVIQCLSSGDRSLRFSQENNQIPILAAGAEDDFYKEGPWKSYFEMSADPEVYITGRQPRDAGWWSEWAENADADMQNMLLGNATSEEILKKWDEYWTEKGQ